MHDVEISVATMGRLLVNLGYHYMKGESRHIHADSPGNVQFRANYLAKKIANRTETMGPHGLVSGVNRPEVYLDESYCNVNHVTGKTWLTSEKYATKRAVWGQGTNSIATCFIRSKYHF
jgi:hypothetical protein